MVLITGGFYALATLIGDLGPIIGTGDPKSSLLAGMASLAAPHVGPRPPSWREPSYVDYSNRGGVHRPLSVSTVTRLLRLDLHSEDARFLGAGGRRAAIGDELRMDERGVLPPSMLRATEGLLARVHAASARYVPG